MSFGKCFLVNGHWQTFFSTVHWQMSESKRPPTAQSKAQWTFASWTFASGNLSHIWQEATFSWKQENACAMAALDLYPDLSNNPKNSMKYFLLKWDWSIRNRIVKWRKSSSVMVLQKFPSLYKVWNKNNLCHFNNFGSTFSQFNSSVIEARLSSAKWGGWRRFLFQSHIQSPGGQNPPSRLDSSWPHWAVARPECRWPYRRQSRPRRQLSEQSPPAPK